MWTFYIDLSTDLVMVVYSATLLLWWVPEKPMAFRLLSLFLFKDRTDNIQAIYVWKKTLEMTYSLMKKILRKNFLF